MQKFVVDTLYELVDPKGLKAHLGWYDNLVRDIQRMGGTVKVHFVDKAGNARGITFGNGKIDLQEVLGAETVVYFKPVEPVPMADIIKFPKHMIDAVHPKKVAQMILDVSPPIQNWQCGDGSRRKITVPIAA